MNEVKMAQKPVLGKGLSSLLPSMGTPGGFNSNTTQTSGMTQNQSGTTIPAADSSIQNKDRIPGLTYALIDELAPNQYQPRREFDDQALKELSQSIKVNGILQPIVVRKGTNGYQIIAGERRLRAAKLAGLKQVPIIVRKSSDKEALELALVENIQRQDLNCVDEALAYVQLMEEFHLTQEEVAERVGKERSTVTNFIRLLRLPEAIIDDLKRGSLSFGHGKALLGLDDQDQRLIARKKIIEEKMSVRATESLVDALKKGLVTSTGKIGETQTITASTPVDPIQSRLFHLGQEFIRVFGTKVEIKGGERKGKIQVHYSNRAEFERIIQLIQGLKQ
jgi:ParB family transcriptional regulator, chromosome partitioning protein